MWLSADWKDFELIDCSEGEKLERWGEYYLVRPDPQAIWKSPRSHPRWNDPDARYLRSKAGGGAWENRRLPDAWTIAYRNLTFNVRPMSFKHTGVFPEQAANWDFAAERIRRFEKKHGRPMRLLNLFAYTGAATISALAAGAEVCHVDAARGMVAWAKDNAASSGVADGSVRWIVDDCAGFVAREIRRGRTYDAVIMDPPSYGRGPTGQVWKIEDNLYDFIELTAGVLSDTPDFFLVNTYSTGLASGVLGYILGLTLDARLRRACGHGGDCRWDELGLPVTSTGLRLPCGATARWVADSF